MAEYGSETNLLALCSFLASLDGPLSINEIFGFSIEGIFAMAAFSQSFAVIFVSRDLHLLLRLFFEPPVLQQSSVCRLSRKLDLDDTALSFLYKRSLFLPHWH